MRLRKKGVVALTTALLALLVVGPAGPAAAARNFVCEAAGSTHISTADAGASWDWTLEGSGECVGGIQGILTVSITGVGKSATLGLCSGHLAVQDLDIEVTAVYLNHGTGITTTKVEHWITPATTYPTATAFTVESSPGNTVGVGALFDHIFAILDLSKCPPSGGASSTFFAWAEQSAKSF